MLAKAAITDAAELQSGRLVFREQDLANLSETAMRQPLARYRHGVPGPHERTKPTPERQMRGLRSPLHLRARAQFVKLRLPSHIERKQRAGGKSATGTDQAFILARRQHRHAFEYPVLQKSGH